MERQAGCFGSEDLIFFRPRFWAWVLFPLLLFFLSACVPVSVSANESGNAQHRAALTLHATPTFFLPVTNTPRASRPLPSLTPLPTPTATPTPPPYRFHGIDFADTQQSIMLALQPPDGQVNAGRTLTIVFRPGWPCEWPDHRACISLESGGRVILATVHSGVGMEAQPLRHALEGTGINRAAFSLEEIQRNLESLTNVPATLTQNSNRANLRALALTRIPAARLADYYSQPYDQSLRMAAEWTPALAAALDGSQPLLVIETCAWRHPAEAWAPGVTDTSGGIYLLVIGQ